MLKNEIYHFFSEHGVYSNSKAGHLWNVAGDGADTTWSWRGRKPINFVYWAPALCLHIMNYSNIRGRRLHVVLYYVCCAVVREFIGGVKVQPTPGNRTSFWSPIHHQRSRQQVRPWTVTASILRLARCGSCF